MVPSQPTLQLLPIEQILPHPDNPRLFRRQDVIDGIAANLDGSFPQKHAVHVRPLGSQYQLLSGHHRREASLQAGLKEIWAWVEDLDDQEAFMELVLSNSQGELSPLEYGFHVLKAVSLARAGRGKKRDGLRTYAAAVRKDVGYLSALRAAARVYSSLEIVGLTQQFQDKAMHLVEIHAAPREHWQPLVQAFSDWHSADPEHHHWTVSKTKRTLPQVKDSLAAIEEGWQSFFPPQQLIRAVILDDREPKDFAALCRLATQIAETVQEHQETLPEERKRWRTWLREHPLATTWTKKSLQDYLLDLRRTIALALGTSATDATPESLTAGSEIIGSGVFAGDFRNLLSRFPEKSVDLILTDPPYDDDSLPLFPAVAQEAARLLRPGGSLITFAPHYALGQVIQDMGQHLRFWWTLAVQHTGGNRRFPGKWVFVGWKPMLWFVREHRASKDFVSDFIQSAADFQDEEGVRQLHEWQQGSREAEYLIEHLTTPGGVVLDPMCGSGTNLVAAQKLGRLSLGIDLDTENVTLARSRLENHPGLDSTSGA